MRALRNTFLLLLAATGLASCGGGGGGSNTATNHVTETVTVTSDAGTIYTNSQANIIVTVKTSDGAPAPDGQGVTLTVTPGNLGTVSGGGNSGATATKSLSGGQATFEFNSSGQAGTVVLTASVSVQAVGDIQGTYTFTGATNVNIQVGNKQDPRLQLTATTQVLPLNPFIGEAEDGSKGFFTNSLGSPYISEVTVTWRHSNGQLVSGGKINDAVTPTTIATLSELDDPNTTWSGANSNPPKIDGNEFLTLVGSESVSVSAGVGTIFVHSGDVPGTALLSVTAVDPDDGETISSQMVFTVAGAAPNTNPSSVVASTDGTAYISGSNGPQSTVVTAEVFDGSNAFVADPNNSDNVTFQIVGPANSDARLTTTNAAGQQQTGTTVSTLTHNGVATVTFQSGTQQGPVQVKVTADRADNNVDNGITDPVSSTATVVVSDGKLYSLTLDVPAADTATGISAGVAEDANNPGNYQINVLAKAVDRQGNFVLPSTVIGFGDIDTPQAPSATLPLLNWFQISGSHGDPQEGGNLFTATDGHFTTAGGGAGPGDTLLVIGKASEGAPAGNDDLETSDKITAINSATSLNVATPFNLNDTTGVSVDNHNVLPYIIGRAEFAVISSPASTTSGAGTQADNALTVLSYPASEVGKAVAVWAQGTGTDQNASPGLTKVVADIKVFTLPGLNTGKNGVITASPDPLLGNTTENVTVCYYDDKGRPVPNFDISFSFDLLGIGQGSVDGVNESGKLAHLTGANGCATATVTTASLPPTGNAGTQTLPNVTFSAGPADQTGNNVEPTTAQAVVPFVVDAAQLQTTCTTPTVGPTGSVYDVTLHLLDSSGHPITNEPIQASCQVTSATGSITAGTILATDQTGLTIAPITVNPAGTTGRCLFTTTHFPNLVASITFTTNGTGSCSGGFSPSP